jgi:hypothetical protein
MLSSKLIPYSTACASNKIRKNAKKITTRLICPIIVHFLEIDEKMNCLLGTIQTFSLNYHIIITIISKFGQNFFLKNDMKTYISP